MKRDPKEPRFLIPFPWIIWPLALGIGLIKVATGEPIIGWLLIGLVIVSTFLIRGSDWYP